MTPALEIERLSKIYDNGHEALKEISFSVEQGDFFALLGPNGAGKSTTLGIVSSLINKSSGSVRVFGYDLDKDLVMAKTCLGVVPQEINFNQFEKVGDIPVTQAGYYGIAPAEARKRSEHYLRQLGLWEKRDQPSRMLSGGMKRRLMIARALIHQPRLLILDEPTAGVDIELRRSMWKFLQEINQQGTTIILTTHYLEEAEALCRNIAIIDDGRILENTSKKALLNTLHNETFVLDLENEPSDLSALAPFSAQLNKEGQLEVVVDRSQNLNQLFLLLEKQGLHVKSLRAKSNRLEELFLSLVEKGEPGLQGEGAGA